MATLNTRTERTNAQRYLAGDYDFNDHQAGVVTEALRALSEIPDKGPDHKGWVTARLVQLTPGDHLELPPTPAVLSVAGELVGIDGLEVHTNNRGLVFRRKRGMSLMHASRECGRAASRDQHGESRVDDAPEAHGGATAAVSIAQPAGDAATTGAGSYEPYTDTGEGHGLPLASIGPDGIGGLLSHQITEN